MNVLRPDAFLIVSSPVEHELTMVAALTLLLDFSGRA
jgi:hypothetical protein